MEHACPVAFTGCSDVSPRARNRPHASCSGYAPRGPRASRSGLDPQASRSGRDPRASARGSPGPAPRAAARALAARAAPRERLIA